MKLQSGHEVVPLEGHEREKQLKDFQGYTNGLIRLMPGRWLFPTRFQKVADRIYNFQHKKSDVVVMTWPKCGTTWTQEIVWTMMNSPNLDHPDAKSPILARSPFIEMDMFFPELKPGELPPSEDPFYVAFKKVCGNKNPADGMHVQLAEDVADPRLIKTHLPFSLMPPALLDTCKVVYVARNPKDVIVSFHHHSRLVKLHDYVGTFADFAQYFVDDDLVFGPYWLHLKEAWERRTHKNLHFIFYEDLKVNPLAEIKKLDTFLNTDLTEAQLNGIVKYTSFKEMRARDNAPVFEFEQKGVKVEAFNGEVIKKDGGFFRKGESGDWKGKFTPEMDDKVNHWIRKNLDNLGLEFKYGL
ncbi:sulfotransferase 1C4-like [Palaemon carinicauda]|uniref:sulfotransferase 1C4-like n=1 Tax=Palaemon carinicauda TaxID=392227 RepID=UPI0035B5FDA2